MTLSIMTLNRMTLFKTEKFVLLSVEFKQIVMCWDYSMRLFTNWWYDEFHYIE
jgi:hypothetical protein